MRALLIGITIGVGMSVLRAPLGVELVQLAGTTAATGCAFRAGGFALCALAVLLAVPRLEGPGFGTRVFTGLALGFAAHGLWLGWAPAAHRGLIGVGVALLFLTFLAGRAGVAAREYTELRPERPGSALGLAMVGAGLAVVFEGLARPLRWFGGGLPADDALFACCLLLPAALVALAFGRALSSHTGSLVGRLLGAGTAAVGALAGSWLLDGFADPRRLKPHLGRVGVDVSEHGTLAFDAWIALPVFALAALGLGLLIAGVRRREQWAALAIGGLAGTLVLPRLWSGADAPLQTADAVQLLRFGGVVAGLGALLATWAEDQGARHHWRLAAGLPALLLAWFLPLPQLSLQPSWRMEPPHVMWQADTPEGWISLEERQDIAVVCLNGRPLTPEREWRENERRLIHAAWRGRPAGARRVLFIGQLGPARAAALLEVGVREVDRCAAWSESMQELEEHAFARENQSPPPGRRLSPREARARLAAGEYDFVYAPPVYGRAPRTRQLGAPSGVSAAIAFDGASPTAERGLGEHVVPVQTGLEQLGVVVFGGEHAELGVDALLAGPALSAESPWRRLMRREDDRARFHRARLAGRLQLANSRADQLGTLETDALARQLAAQRRSSPFESPAERVELPDDALGLWRAAGLVQPLSHLTRSALEDLAVLLVEKRMPEEALEYLTQVADRHWPWPALERALALSQLELLNPTGARERLDALAEEGGIDGADWWLLAWAQAAAGDPAAAEESAGKARERHVRAPRFEARLAEALGQEPEQGPLSPSEAHHEH